MYKHTCKTIEFDVVEERSTTKYIQTNGTDSKEQKILNKNWNFSLTLATSCEKEIVKKKKRQIDSQLKFWPKLELWNTAAVLLSFPVHEW